MRKIISLLSIYIIHHYCFVRTVILSLKLSDEVESALNPLIETRWLSLVRSESSEERGDHPTELRASKTRSENGFTALIFAPLFIKEKWKNSKYFEVFSTINSLDPNE